MLLGVYFFLSLGYLWEGNLLIYELPFFRHYRWPARWTPEFCAVAALLTGIGVEPHLATQGRIALLITGLNMSLILPLGVFSADTDVFTAGDASAARAALALPPGPLLLYVGRIAPIKGL